MKRVPKILALDIGSVRVGVALSDGLGLLAHPLVTLKWKNKDELVNEVSKLIGEHDVNVMVVGIPYNMRGEESKQTKNILGITEFLKEKLDIIIEHQDERLTTKMAENMLKDVNKKASKNRDIIDQIAAVNILQIYLDKNRA